MKIQNPRTKTREAGNGRLANTKENVREAHTKPPLTFFPLSAASFRSKRAVGLGEHCLSTWPRSGSCELRSPARLLLNEGTHAVGGKPGSPFLWILSFGEAKESILLSGNPRRC